MNPDDPLLKILACPLDKGPLVLLDAEDAAPDAASGASARPDPGSAGATPPDPSSAAATPPAPAPEQALYNPRLHRRYPIVDGIPQLLPSSGEQVTEDEHERLLKRISP